MKRIIKIFSLVLFILLAFGITTSQAALTVTTGTSVESMKNALKRGEGLTGISPTVRRGNPNIYCREHGSWLSSDATYQLVVKQNLESSSKMYPKDKNGNRQTNGEFIAYVLAADGYTKSERQDAYWWACNGGVEKNNLAKIAAAYQNDFKMVEANQPFTVTTTNAKNDVSGTKNIYGPITIQYVYTSGTNPTYEFGGFNYAFFDSSDKNVTDTVKLCTKSGSTYTAIQSTRDTSTGYYKVRRDDYNNKSLYIVVEDNTISSVTLKVQNNSVEYTAVVYEITGSYTASSSYTTYCSICQDKLENAVTDYINAVNDGTGTIFKTSDGYYYKYTGVISKNVTVDNTSSIDAKSKYVIGPNTYYENGTYKGSTTKYYVDTDPDTLYSSSTSARNSFTYTYAGQYYQCYACGDTSCTTESEIKAHCDAHVKSKTFYNYSIKIYKFTQFSGCGSSTCPKTVSQGQVCHSQNLFIVEGTKKTDSTEIKEEFIPLYTEIEVTKIWNDYSNKYNTRPTSLDLTVYRSTDGTNWTPLTAGTDYQISSWTKSGNTWTLTISNLDIADSSGKRYYYKVNENEVPYGYEVTYSPNNGIVDKSTNDKKVTITNELKKIDIPVIKTWDDYSNYYETRPGDIQLEVYRRTNGGSWTKLTEGTHYTITWDKTSNPWKATIVGLDIKDSSGNLYDFKVVEATVPDKYIVLYSSTDGIISSSTANKTLTITNQLEYTEIEVEKIWDELGTDYNTRPTDIKFEVYRQIDGESSWEGPLKEGTDYNIVWTNKNTDNWKATITDLRIANDNRKEYHFMVKETTAGGTTGSIYYYSASYETDVNGEVKTDNYVRISDKQKDITITNTIQLIDLEITKQWDDLSNGRNTRPGEIKLVVYRSTDKQNWEEVPSNQYKISWTQNGDTWTAEIKDLLKVDANGKAYYFKVEEQLDDKRYEITYSNSGAIIDVSSSTEMTITNKLRLVDISVTKEWQDFNDYHNIRPEDIELEVYRSTDGKNWEGPLKEGSDYDKIIWTKNGNTWTATIPNLLEVDYNGNTYQYQVKEKDQTYYNIKYSSESNTDGKVDNYTTTITNELKYIDLELTKEWRNSDDSNWDYANEYGLRPDKIELIVYRSTNNQNWEALTQGKDYDLTWENTGSTDETWTAKISKLLGVNSRGEEYYFKVEEKPLDYYEPEYSDSIKYDNDKWKDEDFEGRKESFTITNKLKKIDISGYVWLDGQTGIKPAVTNDGIMGDSETKMANIVVHLMWVKPKYLGGGTVEVAKTVTNEKGYYEFKEIEIGNYYVEFDYDGIHYEDTIKKENADTDKISKAFENDNARKTFNSRFETITYKQSNDGTKLNYEYADKKSTLITTNQDGTVTADFEMNAVTDTELRKTNTENLNLGLVKRGTDIALSTDVYDAKVTINGQETDYKYNTENNNIEIGTTQTSENVSYNLNLYSSDYYYRIRNYISNSQFTEGNYINGGDNISTGDTTDDQLRVYVTYELNLQNQSTENVRINEVKYSYDQKYTFVGIEGGGYTVTDEGNTVTINLNGLNLTEGHTETLYLVFEVKKTDGAVNLGEFSNKAEITSYSTDEGFIDVDSQPGNFVKDNQVEDDNDTARGITITVPSNLERKISGKVFDNDNSQNVNDVIVQLIELKTVNGKVYEYIWQETVSGSGTTKRLNSEGTGLITDGYNVSEGYYEFKGFIPGDYIVRFIYGDGSAYTMTNNVIKYNGQDYKSMKDTKYIEEWYNTDAEDGRASVARDNEARRLETMAYSVEVNSVKGVLLKLLDNITPDDLNETEKETLIAIYNSYYDPDITAVTQDDINKLLQEKVLTNTWMCAETSKIKIAVDTEAITSTSSTTTVNGKASSYVNDISGVNLGIEKRPETEIELKKYITGFKLTAASGETLVNAYVDVNEYLNNSDNISVQGIRDNLTVLGNVWQYEVSPTDLSTVIDGANLEFEYTLVVKRTGDTDYLSDGLASAYNNSDITTYKNILHERVETIKNTIRAYGYNDGIGGSLGTNYYLGTSGNDAQEAKVEVTNIRDYINNDLSFVLNGDKVSVDDAGPITHRTLTDAWSMQDTTINTILKTVPTGKMSSNTNIVMYTVTLGKNPISSTGNLSFDNYIAEVMSYTNAAGRRITSSTPGNAEIIDPYPNETVGEHEIDEADTGRIQIGTKAGEDQATNYVIIIAVASGIALVAVGAYVIKKYFMK